MKQVGLRRPKAFFSSVERAVGYLIHYCGDKSIDAVTRRDVNKARDGRTPGLDHHPSRGLRNRDILLARLPEDEGAKAVSEIQTKALQCAQNNYTNCFGE